MPGKRPNDRESRARFYSPDAVMMSRMHRRRRSKSVSIKKYLPAWQMSGRYFQSYGNILTIIWKPALTGIAKRKCTANQLSTNGLLFISFDLIY